MAKYTWQRWNPIGYEVSSKGDKRFSAFYARLNDGRTIEEAYQLDVKGYRRYSNDPMYGKGKPPVNIMTRGELWQAYKALWLIWANENKALMIYLSKFTILTDRFANTDINQARALAEILNEMYDN